MKPRLKRHPFSRAFFGDPDELLHDRVDPASAAFAALLVLSLLMIPAFVLVKYIPMASENEAEAELPVSKAA